MADHMGGVPAGFNNTFKGKAKVLTHLNLSAVLAAQQRRPIFVNDMSLVTDQDREALRQLALTNYTTTDVVSTVPTCRCGSTAGTHRVNLICGICGTPVEKAHLTKIEPDIWIKAPKEIGLLPTPLFWLFCSQPMSVRGFNGLEWLCNHNYPTPDTKSSPKAQRMVKIFETLGIPRGLKSFIQNLDLIMDRLILPNIPDKIKRQELLEFVSYYRDSIFTPVLPIPAKIAMVVEQTSVGKYYDNTIDSAMEACFTAADTAGEDNLKKLESRFTTVVSKLSEFVENAVKDILLKKQGFLRRVCYGMRIMFAFRGVITSLHEPHDYRGIKVPYHQLLTCMTPFVIKRLIRDHGFNYRTAYNYIMEHQKDNDDLLWFILESFINETPPDLVPNKAAENLPSTLKFFEKRTGRGIGATGTRYPSLDRGSTQQFFIVGLTKETIELSVVVLRGFNADRTCKKEIS